MAWFHKEKTVTRRMIMRFEFADSAAVMFTLDQGQSGRTWYMAETTLLTREPQDMSEAVQLMIPKAWDVVTREVPSATKSALNVQMDNEPGKERPDLVVVGDVTFLDSEWQEAKRKLLAQAQ